MQIIEEGSVRIDLLGGTLDLPPINVILPHVSTINFATSLTAKVKLSEFDKNKVKIISKDYSDKKVFNQQDFSPENLQSDKYFGPLTFVALILDYFECTSGIELELSSDSPAGAGLGGSSAMGVTLYKALCGWKKIKSNREEAIQVVRGIESKLLNKGPAGYQDYYPALYGGVLNLVPTYSGVEIQQIYNEAFNKTLTEQVSLIYSGESRFSGFTNWEVYKGFFDGATEIQKGLRQIAELTSQAVLAIKEARYQDFLIYVAKEGKVRKQLFPQVMTEKMNNCVSELKDYKIIFGDKVCGAGGGGCFLVIHEKGRTSDIEKICEKYEMSRLKYSVAPPIQQEEF